MAGFIGEVLRWVSQ